MNHNSEFFKKTAFENLTGFVSGMIECLFMRLNNGI